MKKIFLLALVIVLAVMTSLTVSAEKIDEDSFDIPAEYSEGGIVIVGPDGSTTTATVYSVTLEWTEIDGVSYSGADTVYYWDADALTYVKHNSSTTAGWTDDSDSVAITITNRSNSAVVATANFNEAENIGANITCQFGGNGITIASAAPTQEELAAGTLVGSAKTGTITGNITASGTLNSGVTSVGTITITIEPQN